MKAPLFSGYTFDPLHRQIDFSGTQGFDLRGLFAVVNLHTAQAIYAVEDPDLGYTALSGAVLALQFDTTLMSASDPLLVLYDDGTASPLPVGAATAARQDTGNTTLAAVRDRLPALVGGRLPVDGSSVTQPISAQSLPLPAGAATDTTLGSILAVLQAQRAETLWTDDSETYFVRVDKGGAITWTDPSGNASAAPGTGRRPADNTSAVVDGSRYQAVNAGSGYAVGDYISHVVTTDPQTGVVVGHYWINVTTEVKLAGGPPAADITPIAPLPAGSATASRQDAGNTSLAAIAAALGTTTDGATASGALSTAIGALRAIRDRLLGTLSTTIAAGSAAIGTVSLTAGSAIVGRFGLDQTTPGTTNGVVVNSSALPAGAAQDGADPASPPVANGGAGIRGWLATIAGLLKLGPTTKASAASVTIATDQGNLEPGGTAITAATMPAGGIGLTGWLSAVWAGITQRSVRFGEGTNVSAAANATISGANRDAGATSPSQWAKFSAVFAPTQAGTAFVYGSDDGSAYVSAAMQAVGAGSIFNITVPVLYRFYLVQWVNGATAGTVSIRSGFQVS